MSVTTGSTPFIGTEIKGATRWLPMPGFSLQPSEFIKPLFAVTAAWLFTRQCERKGFPALSVNIALYILIVVFLLIGQKRTTSCLQPPPGIAFRPVHM